MSDATREAMLCIARALVDVAQALETLAERNNLPSVRERTVLILRNIDKLLDSDGFSGG